MFSKSTRYCVGQHLSPCGVIFYCVGISHFASLLFVCCAFLSAFWLLWKMLLSTFVHTCYMLIFLLDSSSGVELLLSSGNSTFHYVRNARFPKWLCHCYQWNRRTFISLYLANTYHTMVSICVSLMKLHLISFLLYLLAVYVSSLEEGLANLLSILR